MKALFRPLRSLAWLACLLALFASLAGTARAGDLTQAVLLVASRNKANSIYEQAVVLAAPLPNGKGHVGIILNRPTGVKLESLFPGQAATRNVADQVYLGGPVKSDSVIAVTQRPPHDSNYVALMPGLVAVLDGVSVDDIIENTPNEARYFLGFTVWDDDELASQIRDGDWIVRPADARHVLPANPIDLWLELSGDFV
jgi:putative transcriptional regulator